MTMKIVEEHGHKQDTAVEALLRLLDLPAAHPCCMAAVSSAGQQSPASTTDTLAACIGMQCRMYTCRAAHACLVDAVFCRLAVLDAMCIVVGATGAK
jgi:hypothetical protein